MRGWRRRTALVAAAACCGAGCFSDGGPPPGAGTSSGAATSSGSTGGGATTSGATSAASTSAMSTSAVSTSAASTTGAPGPTTGVSEGAASSTTGEETTGPPVCLALDAFMSQQVADAACAACLRGQCCAEFEACAGDCAGVWNCAHGQDCYAAWADCPGFDAHEPAFGAATECMNTVCHEVCNVGPCADEVAACDADPECGAIGTCSAACLQDCPDCALECWGKCKEQHPEGATEFDAFWTCAIEQCA